MPIGGAETLLVNLIRRLDRERFSPELRCLKELGPLGQQLSLEIPTHCGMLTNKYDLRVLPRLVSLIRDRKIDALITVGAGDKMFWGRLAARFARLPVTLSALHSTGWPDTIGRANRGLTSITDAFIAVAAEHGRYLVEQERLPPAKVRVVPNGVDVNRFRPDPSARSQVRQEFGLSADTPVCGIVAALRPEKNHASFIQAASLVRRQHPEVHFLIVGDEPQRDELVRQAAAAGLADHAHFCGSRHDVQRVLAALDIFALTSHNEANPVSILEAMSPDCRWLPLRSDRSPRPCITAKRAFSPRPGMPKKSRLTGKRYSRAQTSRTTSAPLVGSES